MNLHGFQLSDTMRQAVLRSDNILFDYGQEKRGTKSHN